MAQVINEMDVPSHSFVFHGTGERSHIVEKLCTVAQRPDTHGYSTSRGIPRLRRAISRWYQDRYDVEIDPESEAIVTIGSKEGLAHLMLATLQRFAGGISV